MKKISRFNRAVQCQPVLMHLLGVILVPIMIVFLPIVMYAVLYPADLPFLRAIQQVPWGAVLLVIVIAAALSLLQMPWGVRIQAAEPGTEETEAEADTTITIAIQTDSHDATAAIIDSPALDGDEEEGGGLAVSVPEKTL